VIEAGRLYVSAFALASDEQTTAPLLGHSSKKFTYLLRVANLTGLLGTIAGRYPHAGVAPHTGDSISG